MRPRRFAKLEIAKTSDYKTHLNQYPTIYLDFNAFADVGKKEVVKYFQKEVISELKVVYDYFLEEIELYVKYDPETLRPLITKMLNGECVGEMLCLSTMI